MVDACCQSRIGVHAIVLRGLRAVMRNVAPWLAGAVATGDMPKPLPDMYCHCCVQ